MEFDLEKDNEGDESLSSLRLQIACLKRKLLEEKERYELLRLQPEVAKLMASQELDKYTRDCLALNEAVVRLEDERRTLREREQKDRETIKNLLKKIDAKEEEFTQKVIEHSVCMMKCGELEAKLSKLASETAVEFEEKERELSKKFFEIAERNRALEEKGLILYEENCRLKEKVSDQERSREKKYGEVEDRILKLVKEKFDLVEKVKGVDISGKTALEVVDELSRATADCSTQQKSSSKDLISSPGPTRKRVSIVVDSDGDSEHGGSDSVGEGDGIQVREFISNGVKVASTGVANAQTPSESAKNIQKENNKSPGLKKKIKLSDLSCSSTVRNLVSTSTVGFLTKEFKIPAQGTLKNQKSRRTYTGRIPSSDQAGCAKMRAEILKSNLMSCNPSFVRSMALSHVSGSFWLNLPRKFCKENLPVQNLNMILEDEGSVEYQVNYMSHGTALSGGWKGFALAHNLELEDALLFELRKPARFKVYIIKAIPEESPEDSNDRISGEHVDGMIKLADTNTIENQDVDLCDFQRKPPEAGHAMPTRRESGIKNM